MSSKGGSSGKYVTCSWTNRQGNTCTNYSDGGYRLIITFSSVFTYIRYSNANGSSYYDTGKGHSFYKR